MGLVCSRPISDFLERGFLKVAELIDHLVRLTNKLFQAGLTTCLTLTLGKNSPPVQQRRHDSIYYANAHGHAATAQELRLAEKRQRSERRKRAEAAALGHKISRTRPGPAGQGYGRVASADPDEQRKSIQQSLGEPARAPPPRPEAERETARERDRGKLWVLGNVAASANDPSEAPLLQPASPVTLQRPDKVRAAEAIELCEKRTPRPREGVLLGSDNPPLAALKVHEHVRHASGEKRASATHIEVIASSSSPPVDFAQRPLGPEGKAAARVDDQGTAAEPRPGRAEPKPRTTSRPSPVSDDKVRPRAPGGHAPASGFHSRPQAKVSTSTSDHGILHSGAVAVKKGAVTTPPTDVSGQEMLKLSPAPLTTAFDGPHAHASKAKPDLRKPRPRVSLDVRQLEANAKASVDAGSRRMSRPGGAAVRSRMSLDMLAMAAPSVASDAASTHSAADSLISARSPSPFGVAELADRACLSARDAPRKERKVWKDEVERLAIQKMKQDAARRHSGAGLGHHGKALRRVETHDARLRWDHGATPPSPLGNSGASSPRSASPALVRRASEKRVSQRQSVEVAGR